MRQGGSLLLLSMAAALLMASAPASAQAQPAGEPVQLAQHNDPLSNFFRRIFEPRQRAAPPPQQPTPHRQAAPARQAAPSGQRQRQRQPAAARAEPQRVAPEKDENARRVVVFGDFFASGLQSGLEEEFLETSSVAVTGQSNASSGLVRDDYFDWPAAMRAYLEDDDRRIDVAVIMIGGNDHQALRGPDRTEHAPRSDGWRDLYAERVDEVIEMFLQEGVPVYWVGLPPVQSSRLNQGYAFFNDIYRTRVQRADAKFIDVWDSFGDEDGNFTMHGPDVNGEPRQLRTEDGLRFTRSGNRKLAHFAARQLRRDIGTDGELVTALPQGPIGPRPFSPGEEEAESGIGPVVALTGAPAQAMGLAGGPLPTPDPPDDSVYYRVVILGETPDRVPGRADDFSWHADEGADTTGPEAAAR